MGPSSAVVSVPLVLGWRRHSHSWSEFTPADLNWVGVCVCIVWRPVLFFFFCSRAVSFWGGDTVIKRVNESWTELFLARPTADTRIGVNNISLKSGCLSLDALENLPLISRTSASALCFSVMEKEVDENWLSIFLWTLYSCYITARLDGSMQSWGHFHVAIKFVLLYAEHSTSIIAECASRHTHTDPSCHLFNDALSLS